MRKIVPVSNRRKYVLKKAVGGRGGGKRIHFREWKISRLAGNGFLVLPANHDTPPPFFAVTRTLCVEVMLEAVDGFLLVLGVDGHILYTSEGLASLLGYLPASLHNTTLYEIVGDADKIPLYNHLNMNSTAETSAENQVDGGGGGFY